MIATELVLLIYGILLAYFITLQATYLLLIGLGVSANLARSRELRLTDLEGIRTSDLTIPVSLIIPAYNEGAGVVAGVRSALGSRFPEFEILVVDDGSTDETLELLKQAFDLKPHPRDAFGIIDTAPLRQIYRSSSDERLWVIAKTNGGKADSANAGLNLARYRYVLLADADCVFAPDALTRLIRLVNFDPGRVIGLGATMRPLNGTAPDGAGGRLSGLPGSWLERWQLLEYASVFLANRLGWSALNAVPVLSGGIGVWRKDALRDIGGFSTATTHEDLDTTIRLHDHFRRADIDYRIVYIPDTVAWTEVPHTWRGIYVQRKRWQRALFESVWRGRHMMFRGSHGSVGLLMMPYLLVYEALGPFVELFSYAITIIMLILGVAEPGLLIAFLITAAALNAMVRLSGLLIDLVFYERRSLRDVVILSAAALLEYWIYRPFLLVARTHAFVEFLRGQRGHERAQRQNRLSEPVPQAEAP